MKLLVVRHGECEANARGVIAGAENDSPLTAHGIAEAQAAAQQLKGFQGAIVSSPLQRARKTAEIIRDVVMPGADIAIDPHFIERHVGIMVGRPQPEYVAAEKSGMFIPGAETSHQMYSRVREGLEKLAATNRDTILVCHSGTYRVIACVLEHLPPEAFVNIPALQNAEVKTFDLQPSAAEV